MAVAKRERGASEASPPISPPLLTGNSRIKVPKKTRKVDVSSVDDPLNLSNVTAISKVLGRGSFNSDVEYQLYLEFRKLKVPSLPRVIEEPVTPNAKVLPFAPPASTSKDDAIRYQRWLVNNQAVGYTKGVKTAGTILVDYIDRDGSSRTLQVNHRVDTPVNHYDKHYLVSPPGRIPFWMEIPDVPYSMVTWVGYTHSQAPAAWIKAKHRATARREKSVRKRGKRNSHPSTAGMYTYQMGDMKTVLRTITPSLRWFLDHPDGTGMFRDSAYPNGYVDNPDLTGICESTEGDNPISPQLCPSCDRTAVVRGMLVRDKDGHVTENMSTKYVYCACCDWRKESTMEHVARPIQQERENAHVRDEPLNSKLVTVDEEEVAREPSEFHSSNHARLGYCTKCKENGFAYNLRLSEGHTYFAFVCGHCGAEDQWAPASRPWVESSPDEEEPVSLQVQEGNDCLVCGGPVEETTFSHSHCAYCGFSESLAKNDSAWSSEDSTINLERQVIDLTNPIQAEKNLAAYRELIRSQLLDIMEVEAEMRIKRMCIEVGIPPAKAEWYCRPENQAAFRVAYGFRRMGLDAQHSIKMHREIGWVRRRRGTVNASRSGASDRKIQFLLNRSLRLQKKYAFDHDRDVVVTKRWFGEYAGTPVPDPGDFHPMDLRWRLGTRFTKLLALTPASNRGKGTVMRYVFHNAGPMAGTVLSVHLYKMLAKITYLRSKWFLLTEYGETWDQYYNRWEKYGNYRMEYPLDPPLPASIARLSPEYYNKLSRFQRWVIDCGDPNSQKTVTRPTLRAVARQKRLESERIRKLGARTIRQKISDGWNELKDSVTREQSFRLSFATIDKWKYRFRTDEERLDYWPSLTFMNWMAAAEDPTLQAHLRHKDWLKRLQLRLNDLPLDEDGASPGEQGSPGNDEEKEAIITAQSYSAPPEPKPVTNEEDAKKIRDLTDSIFQYAHALIKHGVGERRVREDARNLERYLNNVVIIGEERPEIKIVIP